MGIVNSFFEVGYIFCVVVVSYIGSKGRVPVWIAGGLLGMALGAFLLSTPHFLFTYSPPKYFSRVDPLCQLSQTGNSSDCVRSIFSGYGFMPIMIIGQILVGAGSSPILSLAPPFVDDHVRPSQAPALIASIYAASALGPVFGFGLGAVVLQQPADPAQAEGLTPSDSEWIGAWWIGYIVLSVLVLFGAGILSFFPRRLQPLFPSSSIESCSLTQCAMATTGVATSEDSTALPFTLSGNIPQPTTLNHALTSARRASVRPYRSSNINAPANKISDNSTTYQLYHPRASLTGSSFLQAAIAAANADHADDAGPPTDGELEVDEDAWRASELTDGDNQCKIHSDSGEPVRHCYRLEYSNFSEKSNVSLTAHGTSMDFAKDSLLRSPEPSGRVNVLDVSPISRSVGPTMDNLEHASCVDRYTSVGPEVLRTNSSQTDRSQPLNRTVAAQQLDNSYSGCMKNTNVEESNVSARPTTLMANPDSGHTLSTEVTQTFPTTDTSSTMLSDRRWRRSSLGRSYGLTNDWTKNLTQSIIALLCNKAYLVTCLCICNEMFVVVGFAAFMPKYLETQYQLSKWKTSIIAGGLIVPAGAFGILVGGLILNKFRLHRRGAIIFVLVVNVCIIVGLSSFFFLGCDNPKVAGFTVNYSSPALEAPPNSTMNTDRLLAGCNEFCSCNLYKWMPVCHHSTGVTYLSPCYAGCLTVRHRTPQDTVTIFSQCKCLESFDSTSSSTNDSSTPATKSAEAVLGRCPLMCNNLILFTALLTVILFLTGVIQNPLLMVTMRSVNRTERSFALGFQFVIMRILANLPAPIAFGRVIDGACMHWRNECDRRGDCAFMDLPHLTFYLAGLGAAVKVGGVVLYFLLIYLLPSRSQGADGLNDIGQITKPSIKPVCFNHSGLDLSKPPIIEVQASD